MIHSSEPKKKQDDKGNVVSNKAYDKDATKAVFADSGYMSQKRKKQLRSKGAK
ncbi:MAG: hypothetical protein IE909_09040 [Campylobacterales bacterium]|nr:hypothetical protein [Campylobacterales bacterium]